jgi:phage shock protein A
MSVIKRLSATISANLDRWVGEIENHDAVIEAAIQEARHNTAQAKVRLGRLRKEGNTLVQRLDQLKSDANTWRNRARSIADNDKEKALSCLQRAHDCDREIQVVQQVVEDHEQALASLENQVLQAETRLQTMIRQRNTLRARESVANTFTHLNQSLPSTEINAEDTFERWETAILSRQIELPESSHFDSLERGFQQSEERSRLEMELQQLMEQENDHE